MKPAVITRRWPMFAAATTASALLLAQTLVEHGPSAEPAIYPDQIILGWRGDTATSQAVNWRTQLTAGIDRAQAEIIPATHRVVLTNYPNGTREAQVDPEGVRTVQGETTTLQDPPVAYHSVNLTGLTPGEIYAYRVGDGEHWSEWFQFRTADASPRPFKFLYFGDAQFGIRSLWPRALRAAVMKAPDARLMIHSGDLVNYEGSQVEWAQWFQAGSWLLSTIPNLPAPGNHDHRKTSEKPEEWAISRFWEPQFAVPENGPSVLRKQAYSTDYQGVRFVILDSVDHIEEQAQWLRKVLAAPDGPRPHPNWTVAAFHYPLFDGPKKEASLQAMNLARAKWAPLLQEFGVDLVLTGHWHDYTRGSVPTAPENVRLHSPMWASSTGGGCCLDSQLFQVIEVDGDRLAYDSFDVAGRAWDGFTIQKTRGGKVLTDRRPPNSSFGAFLPTPDR